MIVGTDTFAIESGISEAYEHPSLRGLGFFQIRLAGIAYGVRSMDATLLACSFDEVAKRVRDRGTHLGNRCTDRWLTAASGSGRWISSGSAVAQ